ncbi:MAG: ABC transporter ATP-binding protein, partial [Myxococcota bacterium]
MTPVPVVEVDDLRFRYPTGRDDALHGLSFTLRRGEVFGLLGPSGTGKSTAVGVITGVLAGFRGRVSVLGEPGPADRRRLARIGVGFEVPALYARLTARENLVLFAALHRTPDVDVEGLLARVGLHGVADRRVEHFSKGMKSRLDLCRALLGSPELLFLDEPTAALDPGHAKVVRELVRSFADAGGAVLLTTHDMHVAEAICDQVGLLVDGRFAACDAPEALRATGGPP